MRYTTEFTLGLIGSILGILFSIIWFFVGIEFWAHFFSGFIGEPGYYVSDEAYGVGLIISGMQVLILSACYTLSIIFSTPGFLVKNTKRSGVILLTSGIVALVVNIASVIPSVLLIISGILCLRKQTVPAVQETNY